MNVAILLDAQYSTTETSEKPVLAQDGPPSDGRLSVVFGYYLWPYKVAKDTDAGQTYLFVGADEEDFRSDLQTKLELNMIRTLYLYHK